MATDPSDQLKPSTSAKPAAPKAKASETKSATAQQKDSKSDRRKPVRLDSPRWLAPVMVTSFLIGLVWIVAYYIAPDAPVISSLGWWNVLIGFGFFALGFILSTRWK